MARSTWLRNASWGLLVGGLTVAGAALAWSAWPADPEAGPLAGTGPRLAHHAAEKGPRKARAESVPRKAPVRRGPPEGPRHPPGDARTQRPRPPPSEDRAEVRGEYREERLADINDRLDAFAVKQGWDADLTEEVRDIVMETTDRISASLTRIDLGEADWETEREDLRQFRLDQAARVEALLGDEFEPFVHAMAFERFMAGGPPARGRVE